jgi:uncharacterized protein (DUF2252 family)
MSASANSPGPLGRQWGRSLRRVVPRSSHSRWAPQNSRLDAVTVITSQDAPRIQSLLPLRHSRMAKSPFAFYRGGAKVMALDLAATPVTGLTAQICGDAHLSNFGVFGSPERDLVFDLTDFDETLPGPWEWDVKRLAASFVIAARHNGHSGADAEEYAMRACAAYRGAVASMADMGFLEAWYAHVTARDIQEAFDDDWSKKKRKASKEFVRKARSKDSHHALKKLTEQTDGHSTFRIVHQPGLVVPLRDLPRTKEFEGVSDGVTGAYEDYQASLPSHQQTLLGRYTLADVAVKVVGVGSVGTRCFIVLLRGKDDTDPLFLQIKEAGPSVLESNLSASTFANHGERVVAGQRLMQAASDSFLGWTHSNATGHHYYWRQLKDMKASMEVEGASSGEMRRFAELTGWTLARAHARSGDAEAIAGYLGSGEVFDEAIATFATAYANQNERDHERFVRAIRSGRIEASADD